MRIGFIGTGNIAAKVAATVNQLEGFSCYAVASRTTQRAETFQKLHGFEKAYGSYEAMLKDEHVDLVYIATPHSCHFEAGMKCMEYKKPALIEKAFTVNAKQADTLVQLSKTNQVFLAEAMWTRYLPSRKIINDMIESGLIGDVVHLAANMGNNVKSAPRIAELSLAGGALLDVGIYALTFACMFLGTDIEDIVSTHTKMATGVDETNAIILKYKTGQLAVLHSSIGFQTERSGTIYGTNGFIVAKIINNIQAIERYDSNRRLVETVSVPAQISGYEYELRSVKRALQNNHHECSEITRLESVEMMKIMDTIRAQWQLQYPCEY